MEMIQGRIYANIYGLDSVAIIVPETGVIEAWIDLSGLRGYISSGGVLNGIAWDPDNFRMFATGKQWSHMFHIFVETINYPLEIVWSDPPPQFCTEVDSTVVLAVSVADPNGAEELEYTWTVNGVVDPAVQDSFYNYSSAVPTVDTVAVVVSDGMFTDSRSWLAVVSTSGVEDGFEINSIGGPTVRPNPFSRSTEICFEVSRGYGESRLAELTVYDVEGKSVKTLVDSELEPGKHTVFWDATDRYGDRVSAGIYLVKIRVGDETVSGKIAVLE
jgi:hypothetical protein